MKVLILGFIFLGIATWILFRNDKDFDERQQKWGNGRNSDKDQVHKDIGKHEWTTAGGLLIVVIGAFLALIGGAWVFLKFLFTPW